MQQRVFDIEIAGIVKDSLDLIRRCRSRVLIVGGRAGGRWLWNSDFSHYE
jgi:hypothetical protein